MKLDYHFGSSKLTIADTWFGQITKVLSRTLRHISGGTLCIETLYLNDQEILRLEFEWQFGKMYVDKQPTAQLQKQYTQAKSNHVHVQINLASRAVYKVLPHHVQILFT